MTTDHIVAISQGGNNDLDNLVPACWRCNHLTGSMTLEEFNSINKECSGSASISIRQFLSAIVGYLSQLEHPYKKH
jgi:hypothetical protein